MKRIIISFGLLLAFLLSAAQETEVSERQDKGNELAVLPILGPFSTEELTASVSTVYSEDIMKSSSSNIGSALFGKVLGLSAMQGNNSTGDVDPSFSIRGLQTLSSNGVLVLVDGFERSISNIIKEEVESVTVLKDAAALALYGLKGANGAILVTTKRGKYNSRSASFSYEHGVTQPVCMPEFVNSYDYALAMNEAFANDGKGYKYCQDELDAFRDGTFPYQYPDVDWWGETIGQLGHSNAYNATFQGGGAKMRYFATIGLRDSKGFFRGTENNEGYSNQLKTSKANVRLNFDVDITPTTKFQFNIAGVLMEENHSKTGDIMDCLYTIPSAAFPVRTEDNVWGGSLEWPAMNPVATMTDKGYSRGQDRSLSADMTLSQGLDVITPGLRIAGRVGYDNLVQYWDRKGKNYHYAFDKMIVKDGHITGNTSRIEGGTDSELTFNRQNGGMQYRFNAEAVVDYRRTFKRHGIYAAVIASASRDVRENVDNSLNRMNLSFYAHYGYDRRYFVDLALVESASNRLPSGHKFAFSPTLSAAWVISNERFMASAKWLDLLKLRASAGIQHNDYVPSWTIADALFDTGGNAWFTNEYTNYSGLVRARNVTRWFKPERAIRLNVGLDLSVFDSLILTADVYGQRRDRIMVATGSRVSTVFGEKASYEPYGIVDSYGVEVGLDYDKSFANGLRINFGGKFTYNRNVIVEQCEKPVSQDWLRRTGQPVNQMFGLEAIGFFKDQADIDGSPTQLFSTVRPGDIKYKDQNGDEVINSEDFVAMGYNAKIPEIYGSFDFGIEYKGFGIDVLFQGASRISTWKNTKSVFRPLADNTNISKHYYENRWTTETPDAKYPRLSSEVSQNNSQNSSLWLQDVSYIKLRHCEFYYSFPKKWLGWARMEQLKLYVRGMDLFSIDSMDVFDPEAVGVLYPAQRSFHAGINITF